MMNKIKEVSSKLTHSTRTLFNLICNDDKWSAKVMGCSVDAFEKGLVKGLDGIENGSGNDLMWAVEEMPKHLDILENKKGGNAIVKMRNYIDAVIKGTDGEINDNTRFIVIAILRAIAEDLLAKPEKTTEPTSDSKPVKHFTAKEVKADGSSDEPDVVDTKERSILDEWLSKAVRCEDKDTEVMQQKCAEELYSFIMDNLSKNAELAEIFADMTVGRIGNVTTVIAQRLFDMDTKMHGVIMHTEGIEKQLKGLVAYNGDKPCKPGKKDDAHADATNHTTMMDKLLAKADDPNNSNNRDVIITEYVDKITKYVGNHVNDEAIQEVLTGMSIGTLTYGAKWITEAALDKDKTLIKAIKSCSDCSRQIQAAYDVYIDHIYENTSIKRVDTSAITATFANLRKVFASYAS